MRDPRVLHTIEALVECGMNISDAARRLGVHRNTVYKRLARYGISISELRRLYILLAHRCAGPAELHTYVHTREDVGTHAGGYVWRRAFEPWQVPVAISVLRREFEIVDYREFEDHARHIYVRVRLKGFDAVVEFHGTSRYTVVIKGSLRDEVRRVLQSAGLLHTSPDRQLPVHHVSRIRGEEARYLRRNGKGVYTVGAGKIHVDETPEAEGNDYVNIEFEHPDDSVAARAHRIFTEARLAMTVAELEKKLDEIQAMFNKKLEEVLKRVDALEARIARLEDEVKMLKAWKVDVEGRFTKLERRLEDLAARIDGIEEKLKLLRDHVEVKTLRITMEVNEVRTRRRGRQTRLPTFFVTAKDVAERYREAIERDRKARVMKTLDVGLELLNSEIMHLPKLIERYGEDVVSEALRELGDYVRVYGDVVVVENKPGLRQYLRYLWEREFEQTPNGD